MTCPLWKSTVKDRNERMKSKDRYMVFVSMIFIDISKKYKVHSGKGIDILYNRGAL